MMSTNVNILIAFSAGLLSFLSPCILPLIPSYLSFVGGISYSELKTGKHSKSGIFTKTLLFVSGFAIVFIALGILFSSTGSILGDISQTINIIAGTIVIILGVNFIFDFWKLLDMEKRFHVENKNSGFLSSILLGMAFGAGWTPCVGPILASILFLAGTTGSMLQGVILLSFYSLGLGVPFILAGLFFNTFTKQVNKLKPYLGQIRIGSGIFLIVIGILIILGRLQKLNIFLFKLADSLNTMREKNPGELKAIFTTIFLIPGITLLFFYAKKIIKERGREIRKFHPIWLFFTILFIILGLATLLGILDTSKIFTFWFTFQGI